MHAHALKAYAGQMFHLLCPSPDGAEVWMRRPMSVYRVDKDAGQIEFLYKAEGRGTRGMATLQPRRRIQYRRPARRRLQARARVEEHRGARPRRRPGDAGAAVAARGRARRRRHRDPERAQSRRGDVEGAVRRARRRTITVLDSDNSSAVENVEKILEDLIAQGKADAFFTCGSNRLLKLMQRLGKKHNIPGQVAMEQIMVCGFGACYVCMRTFEVDGKRVLKRVCRDGPVFNMQEAVGW